MTPQIPAEISAKTQGIRAKKHHWERMVEMVDMVDLV